MFGALYSNNTDGKETQLFLEKPFHELDSSDSFKIDAHSFQGDLILFNDTSETFLTVYSSDQLELMYGVSMQENLSFSRSRLYGYTLKDSTSYIETPQLDRNLTSVGVRYELFDTDYVGVRNIRNMSKVEDYNQGMSLFLDVGLSYDKISQSWSDFIDFTYQQNFVFSEHSLLMTEIELRRQFLNRNSMESYVSGLFQWNHFSENFDQSWNVKLKIEALNNPRLENHIIMDEEFDVRGFPYGYLLGDTYSSINFEKRWFNIAKYFDVFNVAAVGFYDVGVISIKDSFIVNNKREVLQSVGLGLRISPTKLSNNTVIHIDLAFPISHSNELSYQLNIFAKSYF